jgi:hypothetical protein
MKLKPSPERLAWHRVLIPASDVAKLGAGGLMVLEQFGARRCLGEPDISGCRRVDFH